MMLSPEQYFLDNFTATHAEQIKALRKLSQDINLLKEKIAKGELCLSKPDYNTQLKTLQLYQDYVIKYFFRKRIFDDTYEKDPTWTNGDCNFILACRDVELFALGLEELVAYFIVDSDENDMKSYEKFEHFKRYNNKSINAILDCPARTKLSYYSVMQNKLKKFRAWLNNDERPREN